MKLISLTILVIIFVSFFSLPTQAVNSGDIVINEIMYNLEGGDDPHEWVEIFNASGQAVDLTDWRFNDGKNHILNIPPEKGGQGSIIIQSGEYTTFTDDAATFLADHPEFTGTIIDTVMSLKNTSATLSLIDVDGNIIDSITYQNAWGADGNGKSLEKINTSGNSAASNWQESYSAGGTPGGQNSIYEYETPPPPDNPEPISSPSPEDAEGQAEPEPDPTPNQQANEFPEAEPDATTTPSQSLSNPEEEAGVATTTNSGDETPKQIAYPDNIVITEIMPSPTGADSEQEWIELINGGDERADISSWKIRDTSGAINTYVFPEGTGMSAGAYLVLSRPTTKITLNNDGDGLELVRPDGEIIQAVEYDKAPKGKSYAKNPATASGQDGVWQWSDVPTPGSKNIISQISKSLPKIYANKEVGTIKQIDPSTTAELGTGHSTNKKMGLHESPTSESLEIDNKNLASIVSSVELGVNPKNNNLIIYILAPLLALLSAIFIFLLKKRLQQP